MKEQNEKDFAKHLSSPELCSAYLLYGSQPYLMGKYRAAIIKKAVGGQQDQMNFHAFEEDTFDLEQFDNAVNAVPFFAEHRCVTLDLHGGALDKATADSIGKIIADAPSSTTVVVRFLIESPKKELFNPLMKACDKAGRVVELKKRTTSDTSRMLRNQASKLGCELSSPVASLMMERCGMDLQVLSGEVDKLCAYVQQGEITKEHVLLVTAPLAQARVFDLSKAILRSQTDLALRITDELQRQREPAPRVLAILSGAFTDLYRADAMRRSGVTIARGAVELHYPANREFALKNAFDDTRKVNDYQYAPLLSTLCKADRLMKSTGTDEWQVLKDCVLRLMIVLGRG